MPTYEYRCPNGHDFERFFRTINSAQPVVACPACGEVAERRMSAGAGLLFKGSGFYITDYGKDGKKDQRTAGAAKGSADGGSSESSTAGSTSGGSETTSASESKSTTESKPAAAAAPAKESKPAPPPATKPGKSSSE